MAEKKIKIVCDFCKGVGEIWEQPEYQVINRKTIRVSAHGISRWVTCRICEGTGYLLGKLFVKKAKRKK